MGDLSVRGVARKYRGISGDFSVISDVMQLSRTEGSQSVRSWLESLARHEEGGPMYEECEFPWDNWETPTFFRKFSFAFQQTWTHIVVRIKLINYASISDDIMNNLKAQWNKGIVDIWKDQWGCGLPGEVTCRLTFEVQFVSENEHKAVTVVPGVVSFSTGEVVRANTGKWHTFMSGNVAAHEYGHYIGNTDHYREESVCKGRRILYPGSVMDNNTANVPAGLVSRLATNIGSEIVPIK